MVGTNPKYVLMCAPPTTSGPWGVNAMGEEHLGKWHMPNVHQCVLFVQWSSYFSCSRCRENTSKEDTLFWYAMVWYHNCWGHLNWQIPQSALITNHFVQGYCLSSLHHHWCPRVQWNLLILVPMKICHMRLRLQKQLVDLLRQECFFPLEAHHWCPR